MVNTFKPQLIRGFKAIITFPSKAITILIILIVAFNAITLLRYPGPHGDDAWMASRALEVTKSGSSFGQLDRGILDQYEGYENFNPWLSSAIQSLGILLFGEPSLLAIRFISLVLGVCLLLAVYWIGIALDGKQLGLLAVTFTAFSWAFLLSAHLGRPDIIAAAFGYTAIAIYLNNRSAKIWISILIGLIATLAFEVHPNGVIYSLTITVLYFYRYKWSIFRKTDFWGFIAGCMLGIVFFLGMHVFPNLSTYLKLNQIVFSFTHIPPILTFDFAIIWSGLSGMVKMVLVIYPQIVLGLWALYFFRRGYPNYLKTLLIITGVLILCFALLVRTKFLFYYAIHFSPALSLLVATFFNEFFKSPIRSNKEFRIRQLLALIICVLPVIPIFMYSRDSNYNDIQTEVTQTVKLEDSILGNQLYWFGLQDYEYYSWENLVFYRRENPGSSLEEAFLSLKPDIFIYDDQIRNFAFDDEIEINYIQGFRIPKSELDTFLSQNAELEAIIEEESDNPVLLYRIEY